MANKVNFLNTIGAIVLVSVISVTTFAFTGKNPDKVKAGVAKVKAEKPAAGKFAVSWYFIGSTLSDATDASQYTQSPTPAQIATCGDPSPTKPCEISVPNNVNSQAALATYFTQSAHDTPAEVYAQSVSQKP
jgi:hypothetical protein